MDFPIMVIEVNPKEVEQSPRYIDALRMLRAHEICGFLYQVENKIYGRLDLYWYPKYRAEIKEDAQKKWVVGLHRMFSLIYPPDALIDESLREISITLRVMQLTIGNVGLELRMEISRQLNN